MATYQSIRDENEASEPLYFVRSDANGKPIPSTGKDGKPVHVMLKLDPYVSSTGGVGYQAKPAGVLNVTRCGETIAVKHTGLYFMLDLTTTAGADEARAEAKARKIERTKADIARKQAELAKMLPTD